jgi:hypothetical protein
LYNTPVAPSALTPPLVAIVYPTVATGTRKSNGTSRNRQQGRSTLRSAPMSFVLGLILFVVVLGLMDRRLPWPERRP